MGYGVIEFVMRVLFSKKRFVMLLVMYAFKYFVMCGFRFFLWCNENLCNNKLIPIQINCISTYSLPCLLVYNPFVAGDAVLIVCGRTVSLLDTEGKQIGRSSGYKLCELTNLKEGETLLVGSKEIEVGVALLVGWYWTAADCIIYPHHYVKLLHSCMSC